MSKETAQLIARAWAVGFELDEPFAQLLLVEAEGDPDRVTCALEAVARYMRNPYVHVRNLEGLIFNAVKQGYGRKLVRITKCQKEEKYADLILNRLDKLGTEWSAD